MYFSRVCRSCLKIVRSPNLDTNLLDMFIYCTRLKISADCKLPKKFCKGCSAAIKSAYSFIRNARQIDDKLKSLMPLVVPSAKVERDRQTDSIINEPVENEEEHSIKDENDFNNINDSHNYDKIHIELVEEEIEVYNTHTDKNLEYDNHNDDKIHIELVEEEIEVYNTHTDKNLEYDNHNDDKIHIELVEEEIEVYNTHNDKNLEYDLILSSFDDKTDIELDEEITEKCKENPKTKKKSTKIKKETPKKNTMVQKRTSLRLKLKENTHSDNNFDDLILSNFDDKTDTELAEEIKKEKCKENTKTKKRSIKINKVTPKKNTSIVKKKDIIHKKLTVSAHSDNNLSNDTMLFNFDDKNDTELAEEITEKCEENIKRTKKNSKLENKTPVGKSLSEIKPVTETPELNPIFEYSCKICTKKFENELLLRNHIPDFHPEEDVEGNMAIKWGEGKSEKPENNEGYNKHGKKVHTCNLCKKTFTSLHGYSKHMEVQNSGTAKCTCKICQKEFKSPCHRADHVNKAHTDYICNLCDRRLLDREALTAHVKFVHTVVRASICKLCNVKFKNSYEFNQHRQFHKVSHLCHYCGKTYPYVRKFQVHLLKHTKEKHLKCPRCPFQTAYICHLRKHESGHTGEKNKLCPHCPKTFNDAGILQRHIRRHTGERPYQCPYCARAFIDSWKRRSHMMHAHCLAPDDIPKMDRRGISIS